jgi:hypothetical protein
MLPLLMAAFVLQEYHLYDISKMTSELQCSKNLQPLRCKHGAHDCQLICTGPGVR